MKILHVIGRIGMGGDTAIVLNTLNTNWKVDFLTHDIGYKSECVKQLKKAGHKVYVLQGDLRKLGIIRYTKQLIKFFNENKYDVVHVHTGLQSGIVLYCAKKCGIKKRICHSHVSSVQRKSNILKLYFAERLLKRLIRKKANVKIACSEESGRFLFGNSEFDLIYNGIDVCKYENVKENDVEDLRKKLGLEGKYIVGQVGRFSNIKNYDFTLKLAEKLKHNTDIVFVFVGNGEELEKIKKKVKDEELNVICIGHSNKIPEFMRLFDYLLCPSLKGEGFPLVLLESQASVCPCLASDYIPKDSDLEIGLVEYHSLDDLEYWVEKIKMKETKEKWSKKGINKIIEKNMCIDFVSKEINKIYME